MTTVRKLEPLQGVLETVSVEQMRKAAKAWREHDRGTTWEASAHDRVDDLIDEIERLRQSAGET